MDNGALIPNTMSGMLSENTMDLDLVGELLYDVCWLEPPSGSNFCQPGLSFSSPSNFLSSYLPSSETNMGNLIPNLYQRHVEDETELISCDNSPLNYPSADKIFGNQTHSWEASQSKNFLGEGIEMSRLWIGLCGNQSPTTSIKKRLMQAIEYLEETTRERDVLIQIWLPVTIAGKHVLTTNNQPFFLNPNCQNLVDFRGVSQSYQFLVKEDSKESTGLPGRVFLKKFPVCTPDVRFSRKEEYPRINDAKKFNVTGSLAFPVFEQGIGTCLGVIEIVTTAQKVNYRPELENVCKALEAVDLRSSEFLIPPKPKECNEYYQAALAEIRDVVKSVCDTHNLPLAQTWAPCTQQGKVGCQQSDGNHAACFSIVDSACYVFDPQVLGFYEACSEHHLLRGEGVAGGALATNQPCFATDITAFSKAEYPLAHHAKMFRLRGAVAIRLQSIYTGSTDFVLEFFLPPDCKDDEEQKQMLSSLSSVIQQVCWSLHVITDEELVEETLSLVKETAAPSGGKLESARDESSWISHMLEAQQKGKGVSISLGCHKEEPEEEFKVIRHWNNIETEVYHVPAFSENEKQIQQDSAPKRSATGQGDFSSARGSPSLGSRKSGEKRGVKAERSISLQVLRQYFPGSLKDAAKSVGVCPTTLKRICRQHGITRWPSRKIKKVGHSLKKLQLVIDSVQGTEGALQLNSFYTNFPELSSPTLPSTSPFTSKINDHVKSLKTQSVASFLSPGATASHSCSSCSHSSGSSFCCSARAKGLPVSVTSLGIENALSTERPLKRACCDVEMLDMGEEETKLLLRSRSHNFFTDCPSVEALPKGGESVLQDGGAFRIKATYGGEKIRLSLPQHWGLGDLQREVVKRFSIDDIGNISLKYLDDDSEWVLLTCDADLEECLDIHRFSKSRTVRLSLHQAFHQDLGSSLNSSGPS